MADDKRMQFIRNIEVLTNKNIETHVTEYEVITDAHIVGEFTYGPYYFTVWEIGIKQEGEKRKLCLRIRERALSKDYQPSETATRSAYYHGGGIADELLALASLSLRRKFQLGPIVRMNDIPRILSLRKDWIDRSLVTGRSNLEELLELLKLVEGLNSDYHQRFILAVRLYHRALLLIEEQPDLAYLNLISAIETLCQDHDIGKITISDLDQEIAELMDSMENKDLRNKIEQAILKRERFIGRRFVAFIIDHTDEDFWTKEKRPEHGRIEPKDLANLLKRIYERRSRTLHTGEPFPASIFSPPIMGAEIDFSLNVIKGEKKWEPKDFIPHPYFFERLVNHVLKTFLEKNQRDSNRKGVTH